MGAVDAIFVRGQKRVLGWKDYGVGAFVRVVQPLIIMVGWLVEFMKQGRIRVVALETGKDDSGKHKEL